MSKPAVTENSVLFYSKSRTIRVTVLYKEHKKSTIFIPSEKIYSIIHPCDLGIISQLVRNVSVCLRLRLRVLACVSARVILTFCDCKACIWLMWQ